MTYKNEHSQINKRQQAVQQMGNRLNWKSLIQALITMVLILMLLFFFFFTTPGSLTVLNCCKDFFPVSISLMEEKGMQDEEKEQSINQLLMGKVVLDQGHKVRLQLKSKHETVKVWAGGKKRTLFSKMYKQLFTSKPQRPAPCLHLTSRIVWWAPSWSAITETSAVGYLCWFVSPSLH